jgi:hypothetical protein
MNEYSVHAVLKYSNRLQHCKKKSGSIFKKLEELALLEFIKEANGILRI